VVWCGGGLEVTDGGTEWPCLEYLEGQISSTAVPRSRHYSTSTRTPP